MAHPKPRLAHCGICGECPPEDVALEPGWSLLCGRCLENAESIGRAVQRDDKLRQIANRGAAACMTRTRVTDEELEALVIEDDKPTN